MAYIVNGQVLRRIGFDVASLTPDYQAVSATAAAVAASSFVVGVNSGAYNAVFLRVAS